MTKSGGYHSKPVILYNMKGFWNSLLAMLDDLKAKGVIRSGFDKTLMTANNIDELKALLTR